MERHDFDMTLALIDRHIKRAKDQADKAMMYPEAYRQYMATKYTLEILRMDFVAANKKEGPG